MSIFSSLYIGMSGMRVNESGFAVIGDNIANMNTVGFKSGRGVFADVLNQTLLGSAGVSSLGQGASVQGIQHLHTQGALLQTGVTTDLAVGGNGLFIVEGEANGGEGTFYTRNGQFSLDSDGFLVSHAGLKLQGFPADDQGNIQPTLGDLQVAGATSPPNPTTAIDLTVNLDPNEDVTAAFDVNDIENTSAHSSSVTVFDSLGNAHDVEVYYTHTAPGEWSWNAVIDGAQIEGGAADTPTIVASGTLSYNTDGQLTDETGGAFNVQFAGATAQDVVLDYGDSINTDGGTGEGSSSHAGGSSVNLVSQDGFGAGDLTFLEVAPDGTIQGRFSNGDARVLGQIGLAVFSATDELQGVGGNLFAATPDTGEPAVGVANAGGRGELFSGALEQSNVDLTNEFTQMIVTQRGFQASSRTITTSNTMLGDLINLIR